MKVRAAALTVLTLCALTLCAPARSQEPYSQWEIFGGGDFLRVNAGSVVLSNGQNYALTQNSYGWHATLVENKTSWFGGVMDFSGDYANRTINFGTTAAPDNVRFNGSAYPFLFGVRFYARRGRLSIFGNPLIGGAKGRINVASVSVLTQPVCVGCPTLPVSQTHWAYALGGGADYTLSEHISIRGQADFIRTHFPETLARDFQNNFRISGGIVLKIGAH